MKFLVQHWAKSDDGILYFFQRLEEMLFHYSSDIVRVPVHNTITLIDEFIKIEKRVKNGQVKSYQLDQIQEELSFTLQNDKILIAHFGNEFVETISKNLRKEGLDYVRYLKNKITSKTYFHWCVDYIKEHAVQATHKDEIEFGLRAWIVEVISHGYAPEYVYNYLHSELSQNILNANGKLDEFLSHFNLVEKTYRVYFLFNSCLRENKNLFKERMGIIFDDDGYFCKIKNYKNDIIGYVDIDALDRNKAVSNAYDSVSVFVKYYKVISNRAKELIRRNGFVRNIYEDKIYKNPTNACGYRSIELDPKTRIHYVVDNIIFGCQQKNLKTRDQIGKIIDLHNTAIMQNDLNDGFLNLWSILEIISTDIQCESKIEKVIKGIIPTLKKDYFSQLIENIDHDLCENLKEEDYKNLIDKTSDKSDNRSAIARFIFLPEFETLREEYFEKLADFSVIRTKIYRLYRLKDSKLELMKLSNKYEKRVRWHIYRLYRTRNAIVHSGETDENIQLLGEHLHLYVDQVLFEILIKLSFEDTIKTISDVLIDTDLLMNKKTKLYDEASSITESDLSILLDSYFYRSK